MKWHILAALTLEALYLISGLILTFIGKDLLEKSIKADFLADGEFASKKFRIVTSSPGLVFLIAGLVIVVTTITSKTKYSESSLYKILAAMDSVSVIPRPNDSLLSRSKTVDSTLQNQTNEINNLKILVSEKRTDQMTEKKMQADLPKIRQMHENDPVPISSMVLIKQIKSYELLAEETAQKFAEEIFQEASKEMDQMNLARARNLFSMAIGLDPSLYDKYLNSKEFKVFKNDLVFEYLLRARLQIFLDAQNEKPLSESALLVLNALKIYSITQPIVEKSSEISKMLDEIPNRPEIESIKTTKERIRIVLKKDPRSLERMLRTPEYRWILENDEIISWLRKESNNMFKDI